MAVITPTITTDDPHEYRQQMELIARYSEGVHIDFSDGVLSPSALLSLENAWRNDDLITHAHIMYQTPVDDIDDIINLEADLVIIHAEAENVKGCLKVLVANGTRTGIAMLPETSLADLQELEIEGLYDHILVFGGQLGYQGGEADLSLLTKVKQLRAEYLDIELAWDGGVNDQNVSEIAKAGVDIINVGSYIHDAEDPEKAYALLTSLVS